jgi:hypothetical protein
MGRREGTGAPTSSGATAFYIGFSILVVLLGLFVLAFGGSLNTFGVVRVVIAVLTLALFVVARARRIARWVCSCEVELKVKQCFRVGGAHLLGEQRGAARAEVLSQHDCRISVLGGVWVHERVDVVRV